MSRETGIRVLCGLLGAAFGAAVQEVSWTFWAAWSVAIGAWLLVAWWHRNGMVHA
jgi:hypothetical protein